MNTEKKYVLGLDIGGTNTRLGIVDNKYSLVSKCIVSTKDLAKTGNTIKALCELIYKFISESKYKIEAISAGFPSIISKDRKVALVTANVDDMDNVNVVELFEKEFGIKTYLERDATMLLSYDMNYYNLKKDSISVGYYIGTGIGNAININGEMIVGNNGCAGEVGHVPCTSKIGHCTCGNDDCFEVYCAGEKFAEICNKNFPATSLDDVFSIYSNHPVIIDYIDRLARLISIETNVLDPENVVIGGGVLYNNNFPKELLSDLIRKHTRKPYPANGLNILYSVKSQDNGIIGAAIYGFDKIN